MITIITLGLVEIFILLVYSMGFILWNSQKTVLGFEMSRKDRKELLSWKNYLGGLWKLAVIVAVLLALLNVFIYLIVKANGY